MSEAVAIISLLVFPLAWYARLAGGVCHESEWIAQLGLIILPLDKPSDFYIINFGAGFCINQVMP